MAALIDSTDVNLFLRINASPKEEKKSEGGGKGKLTAGAGSGSRCKCSPQERHAPERGLSSAPK